MAQQKKAHVPKFGNWDNDGNVPYTIYFDNARKGKGAGKMINPNDPEENPEAFSVAAAPSPNRSDAGRSPARPPPAPAPAPRHERRRSSDAPAPPLPLPPRSPNPYAGSSPYHPHAGGEPPRRAGGGGGRRSGSGGGYSVEQSPVHHWSKAGGDSSESGGGGYGLVANSVDRSSRGKSDSRGNETPTRGSAVPKFGDWDSNPASADGYTHIFNKVREEKQSQAPPAGKPAANGARGNGANRHGDDGYASSSFSCFGWCK